ncbi:MAG: hypothetical protein WKG01_18055 [Kofleriaceae bacterium]
MRFALLSSLLLGACYAPELADCTVTCAREDECAADQACSGGRCAASGVDCREEPTPTPVPRVALKVEVEGEGSVVITGVGVCAWQDGHASLETCNWMVDRGTALQLSAKIVTNKVFDKWTTAVCAGQDATCNVTATSALTIGAKFK